MKKLTILIPCYNEGKAIGKVIDSVPINKLKSRGFKIDLIVVDNNSTDNTSRIAKEKGARVIFEKRKGKGNALRTGFRKISQDTDYVIMLDGDNTYKSEEIPRLIEPLENNFCDVVLGSRLEGKIKHHSMDFSHRLINWIFSFFVRHIYRVNITDVCTGYFAWKKKVIKKLTPHLESEGFSIEMEMVVKMAKLGYDMYSVPITYDKRTGDSNLKPFRDGIKIIWAFLKNLRWRPKKIINIKKSKKTKESFLIKILVVFWLIIILFLFFTKSPSGQTFGGILERFKGIVLSEWIYQAEDLPFDECKIVPDSESEKGETLETFSNKESNQYILLGPFVVLAPGRYKVIFRLKTDDLKKDHLVNLEVLKNKGLEIIEKREIMGKDFKTSGEYQDFELEFVTEGGRGFEFRVFLVRGKLWIDTIKVKSIDKNWKDSLIKLPRILIKG